MKNRFVSIVIITFSFCTLAMAVDFPSQGKEKPTNITITGAGALPPDPGTGVPIGNGVCILIACTLFYTLKKRVHYKVK